MQQWMSALFDDGFVAVKKLKDKQVWLTKRQLLFTEQRWTKTVKMDGDFIEK